VASRASILSEEVQRQSSVASFVAVSYTLTLAAGFAANRPNTLLYGCVIVGLLTVFVILDIHVHLPTSLLWALAFLGLVHLVCGLVPLEGKQILYNLSLAPFPLQVDRLVHAFGSALLVLVVWETIRPHVAVAPEAPWAVVIVLFLAGMGLGAIEEVAEFVTSSIAPTNVGGYSNTGWDLVFNLIGCVVAAGWVRSSTSSRRMLIASGSVAG
jgi:hypothetical protein